MRFFRYMMLVGVGLLTLHTAAQNASATLQVGVWTLWHDKEITITAAPGKAWIRSCERCTMMPVARAVSVRATANGVTLDNRAVGAVLTSGTVTLAAHGETLTLQNPLRIHAKGGALVLSATLPVESYVEKVVASESGAEDSAESLKALAITVRSFALHEKHNHAEYDLCDSTHCQLLHWAGNGGRGAAAHAATLATAGETLWYQSKRVPAWFHQNCGGRTALPREIWPNAQSQPMPWLTSHADPYCSQKGAREWSTNFTRTELTQALVAQGMVRPGWNALSVQRRGESGRVVMLRLDGTEISAEDFRLAVGRSFGWGRILSTWFEVSRQGETFYFHGRGSGHGIGLCQVGSAAMAAQRLSAQKILAQYFHGAYAADEASGLQWQMLPGPGFFLETLDTSDSAYVKQLAQAFAEAKSRSGLEYLSPVMVRAYRSTGGFRDATLAPGWVAAFTEGDRIALQPLRTLAGRRLLTTVARHEFLHVLIESHATRKTPLWLREGLAEAWGEDAAGATGQPTLRLEELDSALAHAASEAQSEASHRAAGYYVAQMIRRYGRAQVLDWLRTGVPANVQGGKVSDIH